MTMTNCVLAALFASVSAVLPVSAAVTAAPSAAAVSTSPADCLSCHKSVAADKYTHGPVGVKMCSVCHAEEKPAQDPAKHHVFSSPKSQPEICLECHEDVRANLKSGKVRHAAIESGGCTSCHSPHGSDQRFFLKEKNMDKLCAKCHEPKTKGAVVHPPAKSSCMLCHYPHASPEKGLLKSAMPELCMNCHQKMRSAFAGKHQHAPVKKGCQSCHNPHSAAKPGLLSADARKALCLTCHKKMAEYIKTVKRPHPAVESAGCTGCHNAHTSDNAPLLNAKVSELCASCHKEKKEELKSRFQHGPVRLSECQACHNPHGSDNPNVLVTYFPSEFYNPYKEGLYALCFSCHDVNIARDARTTKLTNFRNGDQNLHYIHVHSEKGRSCKACHQVHASNQEKHVREKVPFGSWFLPISFRKTASGGSCNVGCHNPKAYDRVREAVNK